MSKTIIDYLSFTGSPILLLRLRDMAKHQMRFKTQEEIIGDGSGLSERIQIDSFYMGLGQHLAGKTFFDVDSRQTYLDVVNDALDDAELTLSDAETFNQCYAELIQDIGMDMLDCLCHGEITEFLDLLNNDITNYGNVWTVQNKGAGWSGYTNSAKLLCNGVQAGLVAWGAKNFGYYVSFSGVGCSALNMTKLHKALKQMPSTKITRVDIALDDMEGNITVDEMKDRYMDGEFITKGKPPKYGYFEGGELVQQGDKKKYGMVPTLGRSFYVGRRETGKLCRTYEKGKQLKSDKYPNWVRIEMEIHNKARVIPLDVLIDSDAYFVGAYPALLKIFPTVIETKLVTITKRKAKAIYNNAIDTLAFQYGKMINFMRLVSNSDTEIIDRLTRGLSPTDIPERFNIPIVTGST